ncbi:MAG: prephenate dehydratase [Candidatus Omnitrophica bacterium]|nr:prephenate dehydratase [Candidatus Omnitrophota bacterium]
MDLSQLRQRIDTIDTKIVELLNERANTSLEIGKTKIKTNKSIYAPEREAQVLERVRSLNHGPMEQTAFEAIYREIMSSSLSLEKPLRIAYLGARGSNSHSAAVKKFGSQLDYVGCSSIAEVFQRVDQGDCDHGVVPIENSVEGAVTPTADLLVDSDLQVCAQLFLKISYALMSRSPLAKIKRVYSNPQVLAQCRQWLSAHLPAERVAQIAVAATTDAAVLAAKEKNAAAITSVECASIYGVPVLKSNIQDIAHNTTRFFVIAKEDARPTGKDRTSIVFSIKDRVGVLYTMLAPFAKNGISLTRIESRPIKKKAWDYYFFVDLQGHREDKKVQQALAKLENMCKFMKVLGSYPEVL